MDVSKAVHEVVAQKRKEMSTEDLVDWLAYHAKLRKFLRDIETGKVHFYHKPMPVILCPSEVPIYKAMMGGTDVA